MNELDCSVALALLAALMWANYRVHRSSLNPGFLYCAVWFGAVAMMFAAQPWFFPLERPTLYAFVLGAFGFSVGSMLGIRIGTDSGSSQLPAAQSSGSAGTQLILDILVIACFALGPVFYQLFVDVFVVTDLLSVLPQLRQEMTERGGGLPFDPVRNLPVLSFLVAVAAFHERGNSRWGNVRAVVAIVLALAYGLATGSKAVLVNLPLTLYLLACLRQQRLLVKTGGALLLVVVILFGIGVLLVNLSGLAEGAESEAILAAIRTLPTYFLGSLFAFDQVLSQPERLEANQSITRFFLETANSLGGTFYVPDINADWTVVSNLYSTNTYTIHFSYFMDGGWLGMLLLPLPVGLVLGWTLVVALRGSPIAIAMFALLGKGIFLSVHSEQFFVALNWHLKSLLFLLALYTVPAVVASWMSKVPRSRQCRH